MITQVKEKNSLTQCTLYANTLNQPISSCFEQVGFGSVDCKYVYTLISPPFMNIIMHNCPFLGFRIQNVNGSHIWHCRWVAKVIFSITLEALNCLYSYSYYRLGNHGQNSEICIFRCCFHLELTCNFFDVKFMSTLWHDIPIKCGTRRYYYQVFLSPSNFNQSNILCCKKYKKGCCGSTTVRYNVAQVVSIFFQIQHES